MTATWMDTVNDGVALWADAFGRAFWQGGAVLGAVWVLCRAWPGMPGRERSWLWRLAYLKLLLALFLTTSVDLPLLPLPIDPSLFFTKPTAAVTATRGVAPVTVASPSATHPRGSAPPAAQLPIGRALSIDPTSLLLLAWLLGVGACASATAREWKAARSLLRSSRQVTDAEWIACHAAVCRRLGLLHQPRLLMSGTIPSPLLVGVVRPAIVLPEALLHDCPAADRPLLLAHELAHLKRRDLPWGCLAALVRALLFFHPLVWLADRELRLAQEMACDEMAMRVTRAKPSEYGAMLLRVARQQGPQPRSGWATMGVLESYHMLRRRLTAMKRIDTDSHRALTLARALFVIVGTVGLVPWRLTALAAPTEPPESRSLAAHRWPEERHVRELRMLANPLLRQELRLTPQQESDLDAVLSALPREEATLRDLPRDASRTQIEAALQETREKISRLATRAATLLTPDQSRRLREIYLQQSGCWALEQEDIAQELEMTPAQRQWIRKIVEEYMSQPIHRSIQSNQDRGRGGQGSSGRKVRDLLRLTFVRMYGVLTREQRHHLLEMLGPTYPPLADTFLLRQRRG